MLSKIRFLHVYNEESYVSFIKRLIFKSLTDLFWSVITKKNSNFSIELHNQNSVLLKHKNLISPIRYIQFILNILQISHNLLKIFQSSENIPKPSTNIPTPSTNIPQLPANIPQPSGNIPPPSTNIPQPSSNILHS